MQQGTHTRARKHLCSSALSPRTLCSEQLRVTDRLPDLGGTSCFDSVTVVVGVAAEQHCFHLDLMGVLLIMSRNCLVNRAGTIM